MSTRYNQYIIAGIKTEHGSVNYEAIKDYVDFGYDDPIQAKHGITVVSDGMSGKYVFAGVVLYRSDLDEPLEGCLNLTFIGSQVNLLQIKEEVKAKLRIEGELGIWFFTHWH